MKGKWWKYVWEERLASDSQLFDHVKIFVVIFSLEVVEQSLSLSYKLQKTKTR